MTTPKDKSLHDPTRNGHCSGCTDPQSEGTHQMGTFEHPDEAPKDKSQEWPYSAVWENGYCVVRDANAPEGNKIMMMVPDDMHWLAERLNAAYAAGQAAQWISVEERLPPIHEEPFAENGFVLILLQHDGWPGKYKTMKASRTIGDWAADGSPLWFWTDEEGEIIDDDDNLITHWMPLPSPPTK